ncbi:MAG TPA: class I SAM-dependent methyltransferase [Stellaceae bacterium]|nr:class I SAM-dependent methyltransferase [Stellaceae bacterium]
MTEIEASAVEAWDARWASEEGRADWLDPDPAVTALLPELEVRGARRALDLGCGVGRHALVLAERGFHVDAFDGSAAGLSFLAARARARGLSLGLAQGSADALPYPARSFDFVLSWNVIYHGSLGDTGRRLAEIWRVLKPGGLYQGTMLSKRNGNYGLGRTVAPDTFVDARERAHPHFYCDASGLVALFAGFEILSLAQREQRKPNSWHWHVVAERRG